MSVSVLMVGTGEYTTGYVDGKAAESDKSAGVVAITMLDLRRRGLVDRLLLAGTKGTKQPGIREHLRRVIGDVYQGMNLAVECFPADDIQSDPVAYRRALQQMSPGGRGYDFHSGRHAL